MHDITNDNMILVVGKSTMGKSMSLRTINNPEGVMYLNCEAGKKLPFKSKFKQFTITDPYQVIEGITAAATMPDIHTIVIDTVTFLMDMFETKYVIGSANTMQGWSNYAQYFKTLMQEHCAKSTKNIIFLAHTKDIYNEKEMVMETKVPIKGSLANNGIEAYFTSIVSVQKVLLRDLEPYQSDMLNITEDDEILGYKHVYQTRLTKETVSHRIRGPLDMWQKNETYIDNDVQHLINRHHEYYK